MEGSLRSGDWIGGGTIVTSSIAFAKIVRLHAVGHTAAELPVHLVQVIGEKNHATDDAGSGGGFDDVLNTAKEEVEIGAHCRSIEALVEC